MLSHNQNTDNQNIENKEIIEVEIPPEVDVNDFIEILADSGVEILVILVSLFFGLLSKIVISQKKKVEEIAEKLTDKFTESKQEKIIPKEYLKRLDQLCSQLAILGDYDRVVIGILHNGVIGVRCSLYHKINIISAYTVSGISDLPEYGKTFNISDIKLDLADIKENGGELVYDVGDGSQLSTKCYMYFKKRRITKLKNKLLSVGNLDLGVLALQYCSDQQENIDEKSERKINEIIQEITSIIHIHSSSDKRTVEFDD